MDLRAAIDLVGSFGRYHVVHYLALAVSFALPFCWHLAGIVFIGFDNDHHCKIEQNASRADALPVEIGPDGKQRYSQCLMYSERGNNLSDQLPCTDGWQYDSGTFDPEDGTITIEWDLVCERSRYVELPVVLLNIGSGLGYLILCPFGDRFGRRNVFFLCHILTAVTGVAKAFAPTFLVFCVFRVLVGFSIAGIYAEGNILLAELLPTRLRSFASLSVMFESLGIAMVALFAYFLRNWRQMQLWMSVTGTVALVYWWWCPESLMWLASRSKKKRVIKQLQAIGRFNKSPATVAQLRKALEIDLTTVVVIGTNNSSPNTTGTLRNPATPIDAPNQSPTIDGRPGDQYVAHKSEWHNFKHFLRIAPARRYYFIMTYSVFATYASDISLILLSGYLHGDIYVNVAVTNLMGIPGVGVAVLLMLRFGRRIPCAVMEIAMATLLGLASGLSAVDGAGTAVNVLTVLARTTWAASWAVKLIYSQEIVPTSIRSTSFGLGICISSIGGMIAPFLSLYLLGVRTWLPAAVLGVLHLVSGVLLLFVPETLGRELPSTPEEVAAWPISLTNQEKSNIHVQWKLIWSLKQKRDNPPKEQRGDTDNKQQTDIDAIGKVNEGFQPSGQIGEPEESTRM